MIKNKKNNVEFPTPSGAEISELVFWSFRYALGRRSAAVSIVAELTIKYKNYLNKNDRERIIKEITDALEKDGAGDDCDKADWKKVRTELQDIND